VASLANPIALEPFGNKGRISSLALPIARGSRMLLPLASSLAILLAGRLHFF
jgi:hypothetical protein